MQKRILSMLLCFAMLVALSLSGAVLPVSAEEAVNLLKGGDFEAPAGDAVYNTNWTSDILKSTSAGPAACTIVADTAGETEGNQCLKIPLYTEKQYLKYFKNVSLQPETSYTLTMDVRGSKAQVYISGDGIASGKGTKTIGGTEEWVRYSFVFQTNSDTTKLANFKNWGISFVRNPATAATIEGETYVDNVKITVTPAAETGIVTGGDFESADASSVYTNNWKNLLGKGASIVMDPLDSTNQCLKFPVMEKSVDFYLFNLKLDNDTKYIFTFDAYSPAKAQTYFLGKAFAENPNTKTIAANTEWTTISYEFTTKANLTTGVSEYPNYLWAFLRRVGDGAALYIDNVSIVKVKTDEYEEPDEPAKELPTVTQLVSGGDFEAATGDAVYNTNWTAALKKGSIVEDTKRDNNHCLKLPKADTAIGDVSVQKIVMQANTTYYVSFDARGGKAIAYFSGEALLEKGAKTIGGTDDWRTYTYRITTRDVQVSNYQNYLVYFNKNSSNNIADTFVDNFRIVKAGAQVDTKLENGTITLSSWKEPDVAGTQAAPAVGGTITVTVTPNEGYILKPGSLCYVTESGKTAQILNKESGGFGQGKGDIFRFALPEGSVVVTAEFVSTTTQNIYFGTLGTSVYYAKDAIEPTGVRFLNRLYLDGLDVNADTITAVFDGKEYTILEFGSLLKRASNTETKLTLDNVDDTAPSAERVWKAAAYENGIMKLVDYTESYLDFTVIMKTSTPSDVFTQREYTARGYVILTDGTKTMTLYSKDKTDSAGNTASRSGYLASKTDDWRLHPQDFKLIATTFDCPERTDSAKTQSIIDALAAQNGSATLNVSGESLAEGSAKRESQIELLTYALENGFEIGSYTWNNSTWGSTKAELNTRTKEQITKYIADTQAVVQEALGVTPQWLRPPLLLTNATVTEVCTEQNLAIFTGNISWRDAPGGYFLEVDGQDTYTDLMANARDGAVWILHPSVAGTPEAYNEAIADLYNQGYRFCTMTELVTYNGKTIEAGVTYNEVVAAY